MILTKSSLFSIDNQLSCKRLENIFYIYQVKFNSKKNIECFRENFRKLLIKDKDDYYKSISENNIIEGSGQFFPILNNEYSSLLRYVDGFKKVFDFDYENSFKFHYKQKLESLKNYRNFFENESNFFLKIQEFKNIIGNDFLLIDKNQLKEICDENSLFSNELDFTNNKNSNKEIISNLIKEKEIIIFCYFSEGSKKNFLNFLDFNNLQTKELYAFDADYVAKSSFKTFIYEYEIKKSFYLEIDKSIKIYFIAEEDLLERSLKKTLKKSIKEESLIDEYSTLKIGDFIVHNDHGVGKYNGLIKKKINNTFLEFIELVYYGGDKLLIPVENLELISRYGHSEVSVSVDKLGLQNWQHRKSIVKKRIKDIAKALIKTAAERKLEKGDILLPNTLECEKFSSEFEFTETSDQIKSIHQIENDLASGQPMDRLICGDVGFGKTEIAMRAAFIAISSGYQVALICPKLLLVNQHEINFKKRFLNFNYVIQRISRKETNKEKKEIKEKLKIGHIDILIGTHAIFFLPI